MKRVLALISALAIMSISGCTQDAAEQASGGNWITLFDGSKEKALSWLKSPSRGLNGIQPITMISTYAGTNEVMALIGRLEHGVYC